ncbi:MAG: hypothetical protein CM15mP84_00480 [Cellvibrionales bacterium]|nr:MAG: hypothetical protein CM15mP84_00480 [Cellvibrionales bacterium]
MHHIVLGINPVNLGTAPFALTTSDAIAIPAPRSNWSAHPEARFLLPALPGHVGADAAGVILAGAPDRNET